MVDSGLVVDVVLDGLVDDDEVVVDVNGCSTPVFAAMGVTNHKAREPWMVKHH